jgi:hypothetical protein
VRGASHQQDPMARWRRASPSWTRRAMRASSRPTSSSFRPISLTMCACCSSPGSASPTTTAPARAWSAAPIISRR